MSVIAGVGDVSNGVLKDFVLRTAFAKDLGWWDKVMSEFKVTEKFHRFEVVNHEGEAVGVDHLTALPFERALDLCGYDVTHANLGLGLMDLMKLDVTSFNRVEQWVHKYAEEQRKRMPKQLKEEMGGK